jgi:hypothetical protein
MPTKFDKSMFRILWALAITGFTLSLPFAAYFALRYGLHVEFLLIPFMGAIGAYALVTATFCLWGMCVFIGRIIKIAFDGLLPQDGDEILTWLQSFKTAAVLIVSSIVIFAILFLLLKGGGQPFWAD